MRIAIATSSSRLIGGVEAYLGSLLPELVAMGHEVSLWHEVDEPEARDPIPLPPGTPQWSVAGLGATAAVQALAEWSPELIYAHGLLDPTLERRVFDVAPTVFFPHDYHGTCISGYKATSLPTVRPCGRRFGWTCMVRYYPMRCGGLHPGTMLRDYANQRDRLKTVIQCAAMITNSRHMADEYVRHGMIPERVHVLPYYVYGSETEARHQPEPSRLEGSSQVRLLFLGRLERLKGVNLLLDALPQVQRELDRPVHLAVAGEGPAQAALANQAARVQAANAGISIDFEGWIGSARREELLSVSHLAVVPSVWPEPFGRVGPEAGFRGVPVAAFDTGGVRDWLVDGENGHLAPADPPRANGLASAILQCLEDPAHHEKLQAGAARLAQRFTRQNHLRGLLEVFDEVAATAAASLS